MVSNLSAAGRRACGAPMLCMVPSSVGEPLWCSRSPLCPSCSSPKLSYSRPIDREATSLSLASRQTLHQPASSGMGQRMSTAPHVLRTTFRLR